MAYAENEGINIYYDVVGNGTPLVLVHGLFRSHADFQANGYVNLLKDSYKLIAVDVREHGQSDKPHEPELYSAKHLAEDIVAVLDDLNIESAHFLGYSMGGYIGFCCAKYASKRFDSFVLGGWQPFYDSAGDGSIWLPLLEQGGMENAVAAVESENPLPSDFKQQLLSNDSDAMIAYLKTGKEYFEDILPDISNPFLLFSGDQDGVFTLVKSAADKMPNAEFVSMEGDHLAVFFITDPLIGRIREFLSN